MKSIKRLVAIILATAAILSCSLVAGCTVSLGEDGKDGQDVSIYEIYDATNAAREKEGLEKLSFLEFVSEYLSYDDSEIKQMTSLQAVINRSLLSSVQVTASFKVSTGIGPFAQTSTTTSQGSGVIVELDKENGDMYVVTNCHVIFNNSASDSKYSNDINVYIYGKEYTVYTYDSTNYFIDDTNAISAQLVGASLTYDLAVLKISGSETVKNSHVVAAEWCEEENAYVGQTVYAVGNAAGDGISATNGIICVDSENITLDMMDTSNNYDDDITYRTIRTSVPIYSGNSGGGLFNAEGELIGIINSKTTAASYGEYSDNISHALPAANVRRAVRNMIDRYESINSVTYGIYKAVLGITVEATSSSAYINNQTNLVEIIENVKVIEVASSSIAEGIIQVGDVVTGIKICDSQNSIKENVSVTRNYNMSEVMLSARVGDTVIITVSRPSEENPVQCRLSVTDGCMQLQQ